MKYVEVKMRELGVSSHPAYRLTAFLDHKSMLTVHHKQYGEACRCWMEAACAVLLPASIAALALL